MKKFVLVLAVLAVAVGLAFADGTCAKCGKKYYGAACSYCDGFSAAMRDFYSGGNSANKVCEPYETYKSNSDSHSAGGEPSSNAQRRRENRANCYEGYAEGKQKASSENNSTSGN